MVAQCPLSPRDIQLSKTVAHALRHAPAAYGIVPDAAGWVEVDALLVGLRAIPSWGMVNRADLVRIVRGGDKQRYELDGARIRASYGHSIPDVIPQRPAVPPERLYHGTTPEAVKRIETDGLRPMSRQYVHLSVTVQGARGIGQRHSSTPVVLAVDAAAAHTDGHCFYATAEPRVWLTDRLPARYLQPASGDEHLPQGGR